MKRFLIRSAVFLAVLALLLFALDQTLAWTNHRANGAYRVGADVYRVIEIAARPHPRATTLVLGDSVARQLFPATREPSPEVLFLPSNQAISLGGQYCLLQQVLATAPSLKRVDLFYTPKSFSNDLDQIFTHDYFCGYFHSPAIIRETWSLKHNPSLTEAHFARLLMPNIMAENSYLNRSQSNYGVPNIAVDAAESHPLSDTSRHFLKEMKQLCADRGIQMRVLPSPCIGSPREFADVAPAYDAPIEFFDADLFLPDRIHLRRPNIDPMRKKWCQRFGLPEAVSAVSAVSDELPGK